MNARTQQSAASTFNVDFSPFSHTYVDDILSHAWATEALSALPSHVSPFIKKRGIFPVALDGIFLHLWIMLNIGLNMPRKAYSFEGSIVRDSFRWNVVVGNLHH